MLMTQNVNNDRKDSLIDLLIMRKYLYYSKTARLKSTSEEYSMTQAYNLSLLINKVLASYDIKTRPNAGGPPVVVSVEFKVISFGEIKEVNMVGQYVTIYSGYLFLLRCSVC